MVYSLDPFSINVTNNNSNNSSSLLLYQNILLKEPNNIFIINFGNINTEELLEKSKTYIQDSRPDLCHIITNTNVFSEFPLDFSELFEYARTLNYSDVLLIINGERLLDYSDTNAFASNKIGDNETRVHKMIEENWKKLTLQIDEFYKEFKNKLAGIILSMCVDMDCEQEIINNLEDSKNMSIISIKNEFENFEQDMLVMEIVENLSKNSLQTNLEIINKNKNVLSNDAFIYSKSLAYFESGDLRMCASLLDDIYTSLNNTNKIFLANLIYERFPQKAQDIAQDLLEKDKYCKGLTNLLLKVNASKCLDEKKNLSESLYKLDPQNPALIEFRASLFAAENKNAEAAKEFRKLKKMTNSDYYELIARINEIIANPPKAYQDSIDYVWAPVINHPELTNEAVLRLSTFFEEYKDSYLPAFTVLKKGELEFNDDNSIKIINRKFNILSDTRKASLALGKRKPFIKESDAELICNMRAKVLVESIQFLASIKNGYLIWTDFIIKSQGTDAWKISIYNEFIRKIDKLIEIDFEKLAKESFLYNLRENEYENINCENLISYLRYIKSGEILLQDTGSDIDEFIKVCLTCAEKLGNNVHKMIVRYYLSIILAFNGRPQDANNYAIDIFDQISRIEKKDQCLCLYLGLIAWGNSQFRLGLEINGIACIIASFSLIENCNDCVPFLEDGINIVIRFFSDNPNLFKKKDESEIKKFYKTFSKYSRTLEVWWQIEFETSDEFMRQLKESVNSNKNHDLSWANDVNNLIRLYIKRKMYNEAIIVIEQHSIEAIDKLSVRIDLRFRVVGSWANILFYWSKDIKKYFKAIDLMEIGISDIERKRETYHKEERAAIAEQADSLYRLYIQTAGLLYICTDLNKKTRESMKQRIFKILPNLTPRSIYEQKAQNTSMELTPELISLEREYDHLTMEYNNIYKKNKSTEDVMNAKIEEIEKISKELREKHPHYASLSTLNKINIYNLKDYLSDDEVIYQYIWTGCTVITILISNLSVNLEVKLFAHLDLLKKADDFSKAIQDTNGSCVFIPIANELSNYLGEMLYKFLDNHKIKRVYLMSDLSLGLFNINSSNNSNSLINKVDSIVNIVDYQVIKNMSNKRIKIKPIAHRIFGNPLDKSLKKISSFLGRKESDEFIILKNESDSFDNIIDLVKKKEVSTIVLYGHGIHDPKGNSVDGSLGIQGKKEIVRISDLLKEFDSIVNLIIISCSSGSPSNRFAENSAGLWTDVIANYSGNIILSKWDIDTEKTIEILDLVFEIANKNNISLDEALLLAQRELKSNNDNPYFWAGLEFCCN